MLTQEQTNELRARLQADMNRLAEHAHAGLEFTMDRDRDRVGRDSMDEGTEEETYSTQLRLHDRETFLLNKIQEAMRRLEAGEPAEQTGAARVPHRDRETFLLNRIQEARRRLESGEIDECEECAEPIG